MYADMLQIVLLKPVILVEPGGSAPFLCGWFLFFYLLSLRLNIFF